VLQNSKDKVLAIDEIVSRRSRVFASFEAQAQALSSSWSAVRIRTSTIAAVIERITGAKLVRVASVFVDDYRVREMHARRPHILSEADFLALPESTQQMELVDGEVVLPPAPGLRHQELLGRVIHWLRSWAESSPEPCTILHAPVDIRFAAGRILQPDAAVVRERISFEKTGPLDRIPELCIEVLSSNRLYDRVTKRYIYAEAGVKEYWIVDSTPMIERWTGDSLSQSELVTDRLETALLPGFVLDVGKLFAGL
jgi:Uma2 family endonuclease